MASAAHRTAMRGAIDDGFVQQVLRAAPLGFSPPGRVAFRLLPKAARAAVVQVRCLSCPPCCARQPRAAAGVRPQSVTLGQRVPFVHQARRGGVGCEVGFLDDGGAWPRR